MNIEKIKKDLKIVFEKEIKPFNQIKQEEESKYSYILNGIIKEILSSYYFEDKYKAELLKLETDNNPIFLLKTTLNSIETIDGFFSERFNFHADYKNIERYKVTEEYNLLISILKLNSEYSKIFEKNPIKKSLNLKEKNVIDYTIINLNDNFNDFLKLNKVSNKKDLMNLLFDIDLDISLSLRDNADYFVVAHNNNGMVGFASIQNNEYHNNSKIKSINYIKVRKEFRYQKIATKIFNEVKKYTKNNKHILDIENINRISKNISLDNKLFEEDFILKGDKRENRKIIDAVLRKITDWEVALPLLKELLHAEKPEKTELTFSFITNFIENKLNPAPEKIQEEIKEKSKIKKIINRIF